jgi:phosphoglycerate dehydrogenase-like enzyme
LNHPHTAPRPAVVRFGPTLPGLHTVLAESPVHTGPDLARAHGALVTFGADPRALAAGIAQAELLRWVQLPTAGIELFTDALAARPDVTWTSAKGAYAEPVAEHALMLTLALLRDLPARVTARSWRQRSGTSLHGLRVVVIGAGGVAIETVRLLKSFRTYVTVVRRQASPVDAADRTVVHEHLDAVLPDADVVIVAAALTDATRGLLSRDALALLRPTAVLVNIGRGALIDTAALVDALRRGRLHGAGLDVTDPEPLPDGHPLWDEPRCIITPHTADTQEMIEPLYLDRIRTNLAAFAAHQELVGLVDLAAGY